MLPLILLREMILGFMKVNESEAMNRRKNADLKKKRSKNDYEKKNIVMSNNTPEAMTKQQR